MPCELAVEPVSTIHCDKQVRDYDQLNPTAKQTLAELTAEESEIVVSSQIAAGFTRNEIINYTDYLRIKM
ncbi:hypothetical protein ACFFQF_30675 [Haladaptatus pallidirubidus]|uniref:Uncharacterized protein n=1 Tax=Haladaptatus pallidirubidus TaxID=1008152 RepID=A0AAV3UHV9_9EURY|nr:hypothetical protein [Haladaptatus pallidirubidus]